MKFILQICFENILKDGENMGYDLSELPERYRKQAEEKMQKAKCKVQNEISSIGFFRDSSSSTQNDNPSQRLPLHKGGTRTEPYESEEQVTLFEWAEVMSGRHPCLKLIYHVPNGGQRSVAVAGKLKAEGVKAGVPDICLPVARGIYHGLYIELKAGRNKATAEQEWWLSALSEEGYKAILCRGWEMAAEAILAYLEEGE